MTILAIKTDQALAYIGLYDDRTLLAEYEWEAHRELAATLYQKIDKLMRSASVSLDKIDGIVCYEGPGSFTGLRIGLSAANALAYAEGAAVVAEQGDDWIKSGIDRLLTGEDQKVVLPFYGAEANITAQKK